MGPFLLAACLVVTPADNLQSLAAAAAPYTQFCLQPGVYRQTITPKDGQQFHGQPGAIFSGAVTLTNPVGSGPWAYSHQDQQGSSIGLCRDGEPQCLHPEDLFVDGLRQHHAARPEDVGPGSWWFDYPNDTIYLGTNPAGHVVETSVLSFAMLDRAGVADVVLDGLTFEQYANGGNLAAVQSSYGVGWVVTNNVFRRNHAVGLNVGSNAVVTFNVFEGNGQSGLGAFNVSNLTITRNEVSNNGALFHQFWGAAGIKVALITDSVIRSNHIHDNRAIGIWADIDCDELSVSGNTVTDNDYAGILYEISTHGTIAGNTVQRNGWGGAWGPTQAGILISSSAQVDVSGNLVEDNAWGIYAIQQLRGYSTRVPTQRREVVGLMVHDNQIQVPWEGLIGFEEDEYDQTYFTARGNLFFRNTYRLQGSDLKFVWNDVGWLPFTMWQAAGNDQGRTATVITERAAAQLSGEGIQP